MSTPNFDLDPNTDTNTDNNLPSMKETETVEQKVYAKYEFPEILVADTTWTVPIKDDKLNQSVDVEDNFVQIQKGSWNLANANKLFNLKAFTALGYKVTDDSLWEFPETVNVSHAIFNKVMVRFNDDFTDVVEGTKSRALAENPNASDTWDKLPLGQDIHSPTATGNGIVAGFNPDGTFNMDQTIFSVDFSYADKDSKLMLAAEDVIAGICGTDEDVEYSAETIEIAHKILKKEVNYKSLGKAVAGPFLTQTKWFEMKLNTSFSFNQKDFGIKNVKQEVDNVIAVNQYIRKCVVQQLAKIAKEVGVAPGQYCEFIFAGLSYSAFVKKGEAYKEPSLYANFTFNRETCLPAGLVVLCQPVGHSSYKRTTKLNIPGGRAARLGRKPLPSQSISVEWDVKPATKVAKVDLEFEGFDAVSSSSSNVDEYDWDNIQNASAPAPAPLSSSSTQDDDEDEDEDKHATGN